MHSDHTYIHRLSDLNAVITNLIYDVGLHKGEDTDFYLKKGFDVVAIEANPELVASCKVRFQDALAQGRLRIIDGAIAPATAGEKVTFYKNPSSIWGTIEADWAQRNANAGLQSHRIEVNRIDAVEIYRSHGVPFYLKIDIEGADLLMLEALKQLEQRPQYVSIESEKVDFSALEQEMHLLRELKYSKFKIIQQQDIPGTKIKTKTLDGTDIEHVFEECGSGPFGNDLPGPWLSFEDTLKKYKSIFQQYRLFGDYSPFNRLPGIAGSAAKALYRIGKGHKGPLPGWYDTHASL